MKKRLMLIGAVVFTILSAFSATAQENLTANTTPATDPVLANMKLLLDDDVFAVGYVNLEKIDVDAVFGNNRKSIEKLFVDLGIPKKQLELIGDAVRQAINTEEDWNKLNKFIKSTQETFTDQYGVKEIFIVVRLGKTFPYVAYLAIPKTDKLDIEQYLKLSGATIVTHSTDKFTFISFQYVVLAPHLNLENPKVRNTFVEKITAIQQAERPDFLEAYDAVKDYSVRILFALPPYVKKIVAELKPAFSEHLLDKYPVLKPVDIARVVQGLRFKAIGLNPEQGKIKAVIKMQSESDAQQINKQFDSFLTALSDEVLKYLESLKKRKDSTDDFLYVSETMLLSLYPDQLNKKSLSTIKSEIMPKLEGSCFTVNYDIDKIKTIFSNSGILLDKMISVNIDIAVATQKKLVCSNNLRKMTLAIHNYYDANMKLPLAFSVDKNGKPLHSWRVMLLPYLECYELYKSIRLDEAWDSEHNKQFHNKMPDIFKCPSCTKGNPKSDTVYCIVTGDKAFGRTNGKNISFEKIEDGTSNTIVIVERQTPVCWMSPEDVTFDDAVKGINKIPNGIGSEHDRSVNVG
ncbi:MAG: DUF1559 domain-containing protein, partial [Planctomycetaceae bacterium]|nr:DUF1559 domain-containing protein [Planctomycetaceae bacterium]